MDHLLVIGARRCEAAHRQLDADLDVQLEGLLPAPLAQRRVDGARPKTSRAEEGHPADVGEVALEQRAQIDHRVAARGLGYQRDRGADPLRIGPLNDIGDLLGLVDDVACLRLDEQELIAEQLPLDDTLVQREAREEAAAGEAR